jgi:hypothetical protein
MFNTVKGIFGGAEENPARQLTGPEALQIGDMLKFQFMAQTELSGKQFQVVAITTYDFEHENYPQFALKGAKEELVFLSVHEEDGRSYLAISQKISRDAVDSIFTLDAFADVFEEGAVTLDAKNYPPLQEWLGKSYYKAIDCRRGYRHIGDYRNQPLPEFEDDSEGIDYYVLRDSTEKCAVEIAIGDSDDSDVYVTIYQPLSVIAEMWPA